MSSACFRSSCVVRLFNVTVDASIRLCMSQFEDRPAPVLVQRATGHKRTETYGNSSPIIHRGFPRVENRGTEKCGKRFLLQHICQIKVRQPISSVDKCCG